jgi:DNA-binding IclR family transcriptional regulator
MPAGRSIMRAVREGPPPISLIDRVFEVLDTCATSRRTVSLAELARTTGVPKSTLHRVCRKLTSLGALEQHPDGYRIGPKLFALGALNPTVQRLRTASMPFLYELASTTGLVSNLAIMQDGRALLVDEVFAAEKPFPRMVGALLPLHATALGKALLAAQPAPVRRELVGRQLLTAFTPNTIVRPNVLLDQLDVIARRRVAYSREEWRLGFAGVAASVFADDKLVGALALVGIPSALEVERYSGAVRGAADRMAEALKRPVIRDAHAWAGESEAPL